MFDVQPNISFLPSLEKLPTSLLKSMAIALALNLFPIENLESKNASANPLRCSRLILS